MRQRIEGMRGGEAERDAETLRPPGAPAVGPAALGRNLGRALLPPVVEQPGKEDRLEGHRTPQLLQPAERGAEREEREGWDGDSFAPAGAQRDGSGERGRPGLCF